MKSLTKKKKTGWELRENISENILTIFSIKRRMSKQALEVILLLFSTAKQQAHLNF